MNDELITVAEVAKMLNKSIQTIREWALYSQHIKGFMNNFPKAKKIGLSWMWFKSDIIQWIHSQ